MGEGGADLDREAAAVLVQPAQLEDVDEADSRPAEGAAFGATLARGDEVGADAEREVRV